jgi:hypothetical protein
MTAAQGGPARVVVVGQLDRFANSIKPVAIAEFLTGRGHRVELVDTYHLSRAGERSRWPAPRPRQLLLYAVEAAAALNRRWGWGNSHLSYHLLVADTVLRAAILKRRLPLDDADLIIAETPYDAGALCGDGRATTLYDCPTPWADELFDEGRITAAQRDRLRRREIAVFEGVDHLAFHWSTYAGYARQHYRISGDNLITLDFGCTVSPVRAAYAKSPRIVYLGSLGSRFIDLPLLSRLSAHAVIDVYGGPPPDPALGLNYRGYAAPEVVLDYQAGLITCTRDELRREGFSAKHLEYLAHGLPVLVPRWRRHLDLLRGSVPYDEKDFADAVASLADRGNWQRLSDEAYAEAGRRAWDQALLPLDGIVAAAVVAR